MAISSPEIELLKDWRTQLPEPRAFSKGKTTDPEAKDFEDALQMYREGVRAARHGNREVAQSRIAGAYLLDWRCSRWGLPVRPPAEWDEGSDDSSADYLLDPETVNDLIGSTDMFCEPNPAVPVLKLLLADVVGPCNFEHFWTQALIHSDMLIKKLADENQLERNPDIVEGQLSRASLHNIRARLYLRLNQPKTSLRELKKAINANPNDFKARCIYVMTAYDCRLKDIPTLVKECKLIIENVHPDSCFLRHIYAIMAILYMESPGLGTLDEAKSMYEKMKDSERRQIELYSARELHLENLRKFCKEARDLFAAKTPEDLMLRSHEDYLVAHDPEFRRFANQEAKEFHKTKSKYLCAYCRAHPVNGVQLRKCDRCKEVAYCSRDCQRAHWPAHKHSCDLMIEFQEISSHGPPVDHE